MVLSPFFSSSTFPWKDIWGALPWPPTLNEVGPELGQALSDDTASALRHEVPDAAAPPEPPDPPEPPALPLPLDELEVSDDDVSSAALAVRALVSARPKATETTTHRESTRF